MSVYHVVCHDCTAETLQDDETGAKTLAEMHEEEYPDHDVEYKEVSGRG